jgi:hypothetical protein
MNDLARPAKSARQTFRPVGMNRLLTTGVAALATTMMVGSLATPSQAAEPGHALSLTGSATAQVGTPTTLQASGTVPAGLLLNRYVNVYAIPASVTSACPGEFSNAMQLAYASSAQGGDTVANHVQVDGTFSVPIAYTARAGGAFLLCGYLHEGVETMAAAQHGVSVASGSGSAAPPAAAAPVSTARPTVARKSAKLVCRKGVWSGSPTSYAYVWRVNGKKKAGATKRTLPVTRSLEGKRVRCGVTARNGAGTDTAYSRTLRVR